jgi:hypothetical protein
MCATSGGELPPAERRLPAGAPNATIKDLAIQLATATQRSEPRTIEHPKVQLSIGRPDLNDVGEAVRATFDLSSEGLLTRSAVTPRNVAAFLAFEDGLIGQTAIAHALGLRSRGGVSSLIARCRMDQQES